MNQNVFSENMKKFRQAKNFTQEQVAEKLSVTSQTVSRWECGTTLPDVLMLPEIAKLYGVLVDDLFKKQSIAYENYAQRLATVYERTRDPEDFLRCRIEFQKLIKNGEDALSLEDMWQYAWLHADMGNHCDKQALLWYDKVRDTYLEIADILRSRGYDEDAAMALDYAKQAEAKIKE